MHRHHFNGEVVGLLVAFVLGAPGTAAVAARQKQPKPHASLTQLAQDIVSPSASTRRQALRVVRQQGGPETLPLLTRLIGDSEIDIREGAIAGVIAVYVPPPGKRAIRSAADAFEIARFHSEQWALLPELSTRLIKALADEEPLVRRNAAYAVGIVLTPPVNATAAAELGYSLGDRESSVRVAAALALGRLRVREAGDALIARVNDEDLDVRIAAMRALGDIRWAPAVKALTEQFEFYVRGSAGRAALRALGAIGDRSSIALFQAQTASGYPAHRVAAYEGLVRTGETRTSFTRIQAALVSEKDHRVTAAMGYGLAAAGQDGISRIIDALADRDASDDALSYLVELGQPHAAAVAARINDPNPIVRAQVATALGFIQGPAALTALDGAAGEADPQVRHAIDVARLRITRSSPAPAARTDVLPENDGSSQLE